MAASTHAVGRATSAYQAMGPTQGGNIVGVTAKHSLTANASANDVFQMIKVPAGATIVDGWLSADSSDAFTFQVGDGGSAGRFLTGASVSGSATSHVFPKRLLGYNYTSEDTIDVKLTAVTATKALNFTLTVFYLVDGQTSGVA